MSAPVERTSTAPAEAKPAEGKPADPKPAGGKPAGRRPRGRRVRTPTVLQMEAVECGAASLAIILGYHGRFVPLEVLRKECGVSRDGSKASNVLKAARKFGLEAKGYKKEPDELREIKAPFIVFWNFNHFLVVEGFRGDRVYLNDPAAGPRAVTAAEFDESFTGVVLVLQPGKDFQKGGEQRGLRDALRTRLPGARLALVYVVLAGLLLVGPGLLVPAFGRILIDDILIGGSRRWVGPLAIAMVATALLRALLTYLQQRYLGRLETKLALVSSAKFLWHVLRLPVEFFQQRSAGDISSRVGTNDKVAGLLSGQLASTVLSLITLVFYGALLLFYDALLTLVGVSLALLNLVAMKYVARRRVDENRRLLQDYGKLMGLSMGGLQLVETLKATGSEGDFFARWAGYHAKVVRAEQRLGSLSQWLGAVPPLLSAINNVAILGFGALRVMDGKMSIGLLIAFQSLMSSFIAPVNQLVGLGGTLQEVEGDLARLDDVLRNPIDRRLSEAEAAEQERAQRSTDPEEALLAETQRLEGAVELRGITFGYNPLEPPLIQDFNLVMKPGARVALVGGSGSGKSTVAKLVAGLYEPWKGEVLFDGKARGAYPRSALCNSVAVVDQDISLFEGSIRENITLWDRTIPDAAVVQAARDAAIHDDIAARSGGYDQPVEEGGRNFSGGQRQRLEIARALVGNPSVLVLDEATSALDPLTELSVDRNLRRRGCTCIIIAHRLSTVRDCDEIIVLDRGKIVQRGTHAEMIGKDGPYARLVKAE